MSQEEITKDNRTAKLSITKNPVANFDDDLPCLDYQ